MTRRARPVAVAAVLWLALFAWPFLTRNATCDQRLNWYALAGGMVLLLVSVLPFIDTGKRPVASRVGMAVSFAVVTGVVWFAAGSAADVRIMCRLF
jgi:hypothetical protein